MDKEKNKKIAAYQPMASRHEMFLLGGVWAMLWFAVGLVISYFKFIAI